MDKLTKAQLEFMNGYVPANIHDIYQYATGGIHIKPSHEGRFTAYKKRTGKTTEEALHSKDPHVRQMANFSRNAAKWHHQDGGAAGGQDQIMQIIQVYAKSQGVDPNELISEIQKMSPDQQKKALAKMYQTVSGKQMQEGGPSPQGQPQPGGPEPNGIQEYPEGQEPQGGQQDPQQLIQAVQQMLQQGAKPEQVIAELIQEQIDPQMIVQIFVQLGMPQEQVMQTVQAVVQQGQPQEQENPQEQMQEQGQKEPQAQGMAYGGIAKYPYGGMYGQDGFRADSSFAPKSKLNDSLADVNMLSNPNYSPLPLMSTMHNDPARFLSGAAGIASVATGFGLGAQALFNNKKNSDSYENYFHNKSNQAQNMTTPNFNPKINTDINAGQKPGLWDKYNPKQDPFRIANSKPTMNYGGNLTYAQKGKAVGFVEGMGAYQPGYGEVNDGMTEQAPTYNDLRVPYDVNKNTNINNKVNTNKKTLINGEQIASNMLSGLGMLNNALTKDNSQSVSFNTMDNPYVSNPLNAYGDYTTNVQGGANFFQPIKHTYAQDNGSSRISKYGGQQKYQLGGQYKLSHDELIQLLRDGAEVEFL